LQIAARRHKLARKSRRKVPSPVEVTKALAALQPLYGKDNVEVVTTDGTRVRGLVKSMKTTQALTKPSVKMQRADGEVVKITFDTITEIIDHNLY
jgi:phosphotransferase system IIB component